MADWRTAVKLGWIPVVIAVLYVGWVFYSRHSETTRLQNEAAAKEAEELRKTVQQAGGEGLKILSFYASPGAVANGTSTLLCYGVANADQVRIEPNGPSVTPSLSRCVEVSPAKTTVYRLIAQSGRDRKVEAEASVTVQ